MNAVINTVSRPSHLTLMQRHPAIGAEIRGIDLAKSLDAAAVRNLHDLWMENPLLIFPGQAITDEQQIEFARRFGTLEIHPSVAHRSSRHPEVYRVSNVDEQGRILAPKSTAWQYLELTWLWHSDSSFLKIPSMGSILHGIEVAPAGGDTLFANLYAVWDALPAVRQRAIEGLRVIHSHDAILARSSELSARADKGDYVKLEAVEHPLVRRHPVTWRRSLFISPHTMAGIVGWSATESAALFDELSTFATNEQFVYRHRWQADDVLMWDNRCTMHAVMPYDSANVRRVMHRTTIVGNEAPRA